MIAIVGWIAWVLLCLATLSIWLGIVRAHINQSSYTLGTLINGILFAVVAAFFFVAPEWSKLHIFWIGPLIFFLVPFFVTSFMVHRRS